MKILINKTIKICVLFLLSYLTGCATTDRGANWWLADFNREFDADVNFQRLPIESLKVGMSKFAVISKFGENFKYVDRSSNSEIISYQKWKSIAGPDSYDYTLFLSFEDGKLTEWEKSNKR
jgi:hypothetical protein